jgi:hypothetical protein
MLRLPIGLHALRGNSDAGLWAELKEFHGCVGRLYEDSHCTPIYVQQHIPAGYKVTTRINTRENFPSLPALQPLCVATYRDIVEGLGTSGRQTGQELLHSKRSFLLRKIQQL